jgi:hypothetical protein
VGFGYFDFRNARWVFNFLSYFLISQFEYFRYPPFFDDNPFGIYEKILAGQIHFPSHFDAHAKDIIRKLLTFDKTRRLGSLKGGGDDIKKHKFFKGIDWKELDARKGKPSIIPQVAHEGDTSNFEEYSDEDEDDMAPTTGEDPYGSTFADF